MRSLLSIFFLINVDFICIYLAIKLKFTMLCNQKKTKATLHCLVSSLPFTFLLVL